MPNRMARYEVFIGVWNTRGQVLAFEDAPATILTATDTYRWGPGRAFIIHDVDARFGGEPSRSFEVMGYEPARKRDVARSYDDQGGTDVFDIELAGRRWRITGKTMRFDGAFDRTHGKLTGLWERKARRWQPWIELELVRAS
jgi:hypothetical protein